MNRNQMLLRPMLTITAVILVLTAGNVPASPTTPMNLDADKPRLQARDLIGQDVLDPTGKKIAKIDELVLDADGSVRYALITYGGFIKIGEEKSPVPWTSFDISRDSKKVVLDISEAQLLKAPKIDKNDPKNIGGINWSEVDLYFDKVMAKVGLDTETKLEERFRELDRDGDNFLSKDEAVTWPSFLNQFDEMDADKNFRIDEAEFARFEEVAGEGDDGRNKRN